MSTHFNNNINYILYIIIILYGIGNLVHNQVLLCYISICIRTHLPIDSYLFISYTFATFSHNLINSFNETEIT